MYLWYQADVNVGKVRRTTPKLKLSKSFDKWHPLNITNGTTKLERMKLKRKYQMNTCPPLSLTCMHAHTHTHTHTHMYTHTLTHTHVHTHTHTYVHTHIRTHTHTTHTHICTQAFLHCHSTKHTHVHPQHTPDISCTSMTQMSGLF